VPLVRRARIVILLGLGPLLTVSNGAGEASPPRAQQRFTAESARARALLGRMRLEEKIGQMTQADLAALDERDVAGLGLGSVLSGGGSDPPTNSFEDWRATHERLQARARSSRLGIPILYGVDAVHGHSNVLGATIFPHNIGLGAAADEELAELVARATAAEMRATGVDWTFAPAVMVPRDERWGRTYEGFSEDPALVARLGAAMVRGFQGETLSGPHSVLACAKHFLGDGGTAFGTGLVSSDDPEGRYPLDRGDTRSSEGELRRLHLPPYVAAIEAGAGSIMVSYSSWNGVKCSASRRLLTEVLKGELGFEGFLVSDWDAIDELPGDYVAQVAAAVNAGIDMFMVPVKYRQFVAALSSAVASGAVSRERLDDAVLRILRVKLAMGLMDEGRPAAASADVFGSREHRRLARRAVRESLVLLRNERRTLPLSPGLRRLVITGRGADDLGMQCGGWTISWQGSRGPITSGTTVLGGILQRVSQDTQVTLSADGTGAAGADAAVVVIGETPYAEFHGDRRNLALAPEDVQAVRTARAAGVPVVVVLLSGRPLVLDPVVAEADALIAAWLPGSAGEGIADVLFGDVAPRGHLPYSWPRSSAQLPLNAGDPVYDPLYPLGYGLSWAPPVTRSR
jgi:beta-glucosidase